MTDALKILTESHSSAVRELAEHLDCRDDQKALALLDDVLYFDVALVTTLNDLLRKRIENGEHRARSPKQIHAPR